MNMSSEDARLGLAVLVVVAASGIAALAIFARTAWAPGVTPVVGASRPEALHLARNVWSAGFAAAALLVGLRRPGAVPVTLRGYGIALVLGTIICCSNWLACDYSPLSEQMDWPAVARFLAPAVWLFITATLVRCGLSCLRRKPK